MSSLLIIKTGTSYKSVIRKYGDYDFFIARQAGIPYEDVIVNSIHENSYERILLRKFIELAG